MTTRKKIRIALSSIAVALLILIAIPYLRFKGSPHPELIYHNDTISACKDSVVEIVVKCVAAEGEESPKAIRISERVNMLQILDSLIVDDLNHQLDLVHGCRGHLEIEIKTKDEIFHVQYDHGSGIYPIMKNEQFVGFIKLSSKRYEALNSLFLRLGFTKQEIGID